MAWPCMTWVWNGVGLEWRGSGMVWVWHGPASDISPSLAKTQH